MLARHTRLMHHLHRLLPEADAAADAELLGRYVRLRDEPAFAALVRRHGPMVLRLCRRIVGDWHTAEDAFQATFLALARQAGAIRRPEALSAWLYSTARRIAGKARTAVMRRASVAPPDAAGPADRQPDPLSQLTARELLTILDEEVERLPQAHRLAVILCCLDGKTLEEAARQLGCTLGSLRGRLERGRARLHANLVRRGLTLAAALAAAEVTWCGAAAGLPAALAAGTIRAGLAFSRATAATAEVSAEAVRLAAHVMGGAWIVKAKLIVAMLLTLSLAALGATALTRIPPRDLPAQPKPAGEPPAPQAEAKGHVDGEGITLPAEAVARIGSVRLRHAGRVTTAAYAPGGKSIASLDEDGNLCFWDAATGQVQRRLRPSKYAYDGTFAFPADGKTVVVFDGHTCQSIDLETGKKLRAFTQEPEGFALYPSFDPAAQVLAIHTGNVLRVVDVESGKERFRTPVEGQLIGSAGVSPDGKTVAVAIANVATVLLYDAATGKLMHKLEGPEHSAGKLAFAPDGKVLFSGGHAPVIWDLAAAKVVGQIKGYYNTRCAAFSQDGKQVAVGGDHSVVIAELPSGKEIRRLPVGNATSLAFTTDGRTLLVGGWSGDISQWDVATGRILDASASPFPQVHRLRFLDHRRLLMLAKTFEVWDAHAGTVRQRFPDFNASDYGSADVSADGRWLAYPAAKGAIALIDSKQIEAPRRLPGHKNGSLTVRFAPDGRTLFSTGWDKVVRGWDVATGKLCHEWKDHTEVPLVLVVSPDGRWVLSATTWLTTKRDTVFRLWDVSSNRLAHKVSQPGLYFTTFAFSPDGRRLAAGGGEGEFDVNTPGHIVVFDVASGERVGAIAGHPRPLTQIAFSSDGRSLAAADSNFQKEVAFRYWELATLKERHRFDGHAGSVHALAFSPTGALLAAASPDAPAYVWDVYSQRMPNLPPPEKWSAETRQVLWRELGSADAKAAFQAVRRLIRNPGRAVALCGERLKPAEPVDAKRLRQWLTDLDSERFAVRQAAFTELEKLGDRIEAPLKDALAAGLPLEAKRRVQSLLERFDALTPERLARERALEVLEQVVTNGSMPLLELLAAGEPGARLTREAKATLGRLKQRPN